MVSNYLYNVQCFNSSVAKHNNIYMAQSKLRRLVSISKVFSDFRMLTVFFFQRIEGDGVELGFSKELDV